MENNMTAYSWMMAGGVAGCAALAYSGARKRPGASAGKAAALTALEILLGFVFAALCAAAALLLIRFRNVEAVGFEKFFSGLTLEDVPFFGAVAGFTLGVYLAGKCMKLPGTDTLNRFAAAGAFLIAAARFAEGFLGLFGTGELPEDTVLPFPLAVAIDFSGDGSYVEYYLAVFMFEGIAALAAMVFALRKNAEPDTFLRTLFIICLTQVFFESLRTTSIAWLFVKVEQLACFLYVEAVLLRYGLKGKGQKNRFLPAIAGLVVCGLIVAEEFALDKTNLPHWLIYTCMAAELALLGYLEHKAHLRMVAAAGEKSAA